MAIDIATVPVQGEDVLLEVSENGVDWYTLVCMIKQGWEATRNVNKTETQCGQLVGKGTLDITVPIEGAVNVVADDIVDNAGFASYKKMQSWIKDFTPLQVRQLAPTGDGASFTNRSNAYLTDLKMDLPVDNIALFSGTLTGYGTWDIV
jgi:hypothetical protein